MLPNPKFFHLGDNGLYYGNYGGLDYSAGVEDGIASAPPNPPPVDEFDQVFYEHDFALQNASTLEERVDAHVDVVKGVYELLI